MEDDDLSLESSHRVLLHKDTIENESEDSQIDAIKNEDAETLINTYLLKNNNNTLLPFLIWIENNIAKQDHKTTKRVRIAGATGLGIGLLAAYASFPLAGDLAVLSIEFMGNKSSTANNIVYILSGINAAIPSMALNSVSTKHQFQHLVSPAEPDSLLSNRKKLKVINFGSHFLGLFSAMSSGYVGYLVSEEFVLPLRILLTSSAYIGCYMFTVESEKRLSASLLNYFSQRKTTYFKRQNLQTALLKSMKSLSTMPEDDFNEIYREFFTTLSTDIDMRNQQNYLQKIQTLLELGKDSEIITNPSRCSNIGHKSVKILGCIIGAAETYVAFTLVQEATLFLCDFVGISDPLTKSVLSKTFATFACIPWGSLDIEGVKGRFSRMYNSIFNKDRNYQKEFVNPTVRRWISRFAIWGGVSAAVPPTYLAIKTTENLPLGVRIIISGATFICPAAVLTEALETMLDQGWSWIKSFRSNSLELRKEKLLKAIESLSSKIAELPDDIVDALDDELFNK